MPRLLTMESGKIALIVILLIESVLISGCINDDKGKPSGISGTGTVKFIDLEGGFYGIIDDRGERYDPVNLDKEFQVDGLRVRFEAKVRGDMASTHMWGTLVEIMKIEKLDK